MIYYRSNAICKMLYYSSMLSFIKKHQSSLSFYVLSCFFVFALFNPFFKKYDYGGGFPLVLLFAVLVLVFALIELKEKRENASWEKVFLLIFLGGYLISFIFSQTRNLGFSEVLAYFAISGFYLIFAHKKNEWSRHFLQLVVVMTVGAVLLGYYLYFARAELRMIGPFFNLMYHANVWPNAFALFLIMAWPINLLFFEKKGKFANALLIGFILSALLLTFSRGAIIVLVGQIVLLFSYFYKRIRFQTVLLSLVVIFFASFLFVQANYVRSLNQNIIDVKERVAFENNDSLTSGQERLDFWKGALTLAFEKPLTGWGPFSFRYAYNPIQKTFLGSADHPHNIFLKFAAENGIVTLLGFLGFLFLVLFTVWKRFSRLSAKNRDFVYILGVSVAGAFAHNLIDYNFNFMVNLGLLFALLAFIRSTVVKTGGKKLKFNFLSLLLGLLVAGFSIYEGGLLAMDHMVYDMSYLNNSFYPRIYYLNSADKSLYYDDFENTLRALSKEISLNPLDAQAYYLRGVIYCNEEFSGYDLALCRDDFSMALSLNPMNDFTYYTSYLRVAEEPEFAETLKKAEELLGIYFGYVANNVHFTAYTFNVEAANELVKVIVPYLNDEDSKQMQLDAEEMLRNAERLRALKEF